MYIADKILTHLRSVGGLSVTYQSAPKANVLFDNINTPCALLLLFSDRQIDVSKKMWRESAEVNVFFLTDAAFDFDGLENQRRVDGMAGKAEDFIALVLADGSLEFESTDIAMRQVYDEGDRNLTGVSLQFRVREVQPKCLGL